MRSRVSTETVRKGVRWRSKKSMRRRIVRIPPLGVRSVYNFLRLPQQDLPRQLHGGDARHLAVRALNGVMVLCFAVIAGCVCISRNVCLIVQDRRFVLQHYRVVIVRDLSERYEEPDANRVVHAVTASVAAKEVLRFLGGGFADCIEVSACTPGTSRVRYLYCNLHAGEFTYDLCSS
jgi:hypothetical protein